MTSPREVNTFSKHFIWGVTVICWRQRKQLCLYTYLNIPTNVIVLFLMPDKECSIFGFVSRELQKSHGLHIFWITLVSVVIIKGEKKKPKEKCFFLYIHSWLPLSQREGNENRPNRTSAFHVVYFAIKLAEMRYLANSWTFPRQPSFFTRNFSNILEFLR